MNHKVTEHKLQSGAKGLAIHVPGSGVVNLVTYFNSGFIFGNRAKYEVPHLLEHLLYSGDKKFVTEVQRAGAYSNAFTNNYYNWYAYECAAFEGERILELMASRLAKAELADKMLVAERGNVREELTHNLSNYGRLCYLNLSTKTMPMAVMGEEARIEQLDAINIGDIQAHYRSTHTTNNMRFFLAGDFPDGGQRMVDKFDSLTDSMPRGERLPIPVEPEVRLDEPLLLKLPIKQLYYDIHSYYKYPDYRHRLGLVLLSYLLAGGFNSWVMGEARDRGLAYDVSTDIQSSPSSSHFGFSAFVTPTNAAELFKVIVRGMKKAKAGDFSNHELNEVKTLLVGRMTRWHQTSADMLGWYDGFYNQDDQIADFDTYLADITSVTKAEIVAAANYVTTEKRSGLSLVGDMSRSEAQELYGILQPIWTN